MTDNLTVRGITIPFPDEYENALLQLRGAGVQWAFDVGRLTAEAVDAALAELQARGVVAVGDEEVARGVVGKIVAHVGRLVGRSSSRVRRYLDLHRLFGHPDTPTGVYWGDYEALGLNHWDMAYRLVKDRELLAEYLATAADYPTETPKWCVEQAQEALGRIDADHVAANAEADRLVEEIVEAIAEGREPGVDEDDIAAIMGTESARLLVVNTVMKAVEMLEAALPVLRQVPGVQENQVEVAESAVMRLQALLTTIVTMPKPQE